MPEPKVWTKAEIMHVMMTEWEEAMNDAIARGIKRPVAVELIELMYLALEERGLIQEQP
jgi:hypothetical protein